MDVTAPRVPQPVPVGGPRPDRVPPAEPEPQRRAEPPPAETAAPAFRTPSALKFGLTTADVDARFEIHEATSTVTVTMYDKSTGEVLRQIPSREVLDVIASLVATGLHVDEVR